MERILTAGAPIASRQSTSIVTRTKFAASPEQTWDGLMFYEEIAERPPLYLRLLLPVPLRTEGRKSQVGDDARCVYAGGHLLKRVTQIDRGRHYEFEVVEQNLMVGGGMTLLGGGYVLRELPDGRTEVALKTRYVSHKRPRWLWKLIEAAVCHTFHRHILGAMRRNVESRGRLVAAGLRGLETDENPSAQMDIDNSHKPIWILTSVVSQKSLDHRGGLLSGSNGGGTGARGHRNVEVSPGPAVKYPTRRGRGGVPQATDLLTTGARPAPVGASYVKKR